MTKTEFISNSEIILFRSGLYLMKIGDAIVDWIHIDNVVCYQK